jgi:site-specific recombinase XerD
MIDDIRKKIIIPLGKNYSVYPLTGVCTKYYQNILDDYLEYLRRYSYREITIKAKKKNLLFFIHYLEEIGIHDFAQINLSCINQFVSKYLNRYALRTQRTKMSGIKAFFKFLIDKRILLTQNLYLIPTIKQVPDHVPSIISKAAQDALNNLKPPTTEIEARDNAILLLTYKLSLRRGDAISLKFSEVNWGNKTISIVQQKTLVSLKLPLPDDVGDALSNYICNFRNDLGKDIPYIFITVVPPIRPLNAASSAFIADRFQKRHNLEKKFSGLHILRRTNISSVLNAGNSLEIVTRILGHSDINSTKFYINLDKKKMSCCKMNITLLGFPEVLND